MNRDLEVLRQHINKRILLGLAAHKDTCVEDSIVLYELVKQLDDGLLLSVEDIFVRKPEGSPVWTAQEILEAEVLGDNTFLWWCWRDITGTVPFYAGLPEFK